MKAQALLKKLYKGAGAPATAIVTGLKSGIADGDCDCNCGCGGGNCDP